MSYGCLTHFTDNKSTSIFSAPVSRQWHHQQLSVKPLTRLWVRRIGRGLRSGSSFGVTAVGTGHERKWSGAGRRSCWWGVNRLIYLNGHPRELNQPTPPPLERVIASKNESWCQDGARVSLLAGGQEVMSLKAAGALQHIQQGVFRFNLWFTDRQQLHLHLYELSFMFRLQFISFTL